MNGRAGWAAPLLALATAAQAGPPFVTDDPEPTDTGHWEVYGFVAGSHVAGETSGATGFDVNYGAARDLQLTVTVPLDYEKTGRVRAHVGDIEFGAKYRFLHQTEDSWLPDVSFFPTATAPTAGHAFGSGRVGLFLPIWAQKDFGPWSLFGGGGYTINPGVGQRDFWQQGIALTRQIGPALQLGAELYHDGADAQDARSFTGLNFGALYRLSKHWSIIGSAGPGLRHARDGGRYTFYAALKADF